MINKLDNLQKAKIAFQSSSSELKIVQKIHKVHLIDYENNEDAIVELAENKLTALICNFPVAVNFIIVTKYKDKLKIALKLENEESEKHGIVLKKDNEVFQGIINIWY